MPETKTLEPQIEEMTIRHLLTHTSGLTYGWDQKAYVDSFYRATGASGWDGTIGEKVKILAKLPLKHQPGTKGNMDFQSMLPDILLKFCREYHSMFI